MARKHLILFSVQAFVLMVITSSVLGTGISLEPRASTDEQFTALVLPSEAQFVIPITPRPRWQWHAASVRENAREYMMGISVSNNGITYYFGFFMWKYPGAQPQQGDLKALVSAGQTSLFVNKDPHRNVVIRNAGIKVEPHSDRLVVKVTGRENVERLFSSHPQEVTFNIVLPEGQGISKKVGVEYREKK